ESRRADWQKLANSIRCLPGPQSGGASLVPIGVGNGPPRQHGPYARISGERREIQAAAEDMSAWCMAQVENRTDFSLDPHHSAVSEPRRSIGMAAFAAPTASARRQWRIFFMINQIYDIGVARQIGTYSDAVFAPAPARWLFTAGTPGLA